MKKHGNQFWIHNGPMSNRLDMTVNQITGFFCLVTWEIAPGAQGHKDKITEEKNVKNRTKWSNIQIIIFPNEERKEQTKVDTVMDELIKENFSPDSSVGKESAYNSGDPGLIPGSGRSTGEGIGYPLQYSWASLVAQLVKNLPTMRETWVGKILWRRERLSTPVFWPGELHGLYSPWGAESRTRLSNFHSLKLKKMCP